MLKKTYRLTKKDNIARIIKQGDSQKGAFFLVKKLKNDLENDRFALVISKKVEKQAVKRNKCRRRFFEAIRNNLKNNNSNTHYDIVLLINKSAINADYQDIVTAIKTL